MNNHLVFLTQYLSFTVLSRMSLLTKEESEPDYRMGIANATASIANFKTGFKMTKLQSIQFQFLFYILFYLLIFNGCLKQKEKVWLMLILSCCVVNSQSYQRFF